MKQTMEDYCCSILHKLFSHSLEQLYELKQDYGEGIYAECDYEILQSELCDKYGEAAGTIIYQSLDTYNIDCDEFALGFDEGTRENLSYYVA